MDNGVTEKIYYGIYNEDPKIIAKRLERPKAPMPTCNFKRYDMPFLSNLACINSLKNLSISN